MVDEFDTRFIQLLGSGYEIERELSGGMSRVVVARETALGRRVVVKMLPAEWAAGLSVERFRREVMLAAGLQHPHVVPLLTAGEASDGTLFYTMPYVEGESLRERIKHGLPAVSDCVRWLRDVSSALSYAHTRGVVHRDMKPDNILLSNGYAMVADFGIAKALTSAASSTAGMPVALEPLTTTGLALGTPAYMAPEQVAADRDLDHRTDIYALGVIAYELLSGVTPFQGSPQSILVAHLATAPSPIETRRADLPPALTTLVMRCLEKDAVDRPQTAAALVTALDDVLRGLSGGDSTGDARVSVPSRPRVTTKLRPRVRRVVTWTIALGSLLALSIAWWPRTRAADVTSPQRVAVATLRTASTDTALRETARLFSTDLTSDLALQDGSVLASREEVERAERAIGESFGPQTLATPLHARWVVTGALQALGADSVLIRVSLSRGADGQEVRTLTDIRAARADLRTASTEASARLAGAIDMLTSADFGTAMLPKGDPPSIAAVRAVREGLALQAGLREPDPAENESAAELARFDRAVIADPTFAQARLWFASAALRRPGGEVLADSALALVQMDSQLTEYERALFDGLRADSHGNHELSVRGWRRARDLAPSWPNQWWLAVKLRDANRPREALAIFDTLGRANPQFLRGVPSVQHYLGNYRGEYRALLAERQRGPSQAQSLSYQQALAQSLSGMDSTAAIMKLLDDAAQLPAESGSSRAFLLVRTAWELTAHAHVSEGTEAMQRAVTWCKRRTDSDLRNDALAFDCMEAYGYTGDVRALAALAQPVLSARSDDADLAVLGVVGLAAALHGERALAERYAATIEQHTRVDGSHGIASWYRARISAALGDTARSVELLEDAFARGAGWSQRLDLHRDPAFAKLRGVAGFERLRQPQG